MCKIKLIIITTTLTWKTVSNAIGNVLKLVGGVPSSKLNWPPKSCMPSRAKMRMNRNKRNSSEMMERMEFSSEMTRLRSEDQYLVTCRQRILQCLKTRYCMYLLRAWDVRIILGWAAFGKILHLFSLDISRCLNSKVFR